MCALTCVLSYVCSLIRVLLFGVSCVLLYVRHHVLAFMCVLLFLLSSPCVLSHVYVCVTSRLQGF